MKKKNCGKWVTLKYVTETWWWHKLIFTYAFFNVFEIYVFDVWTKVSSRSPLFGNKSVRMHKFFCERCQAERWDNMFFRKSFHNAIIRYLQLYFVIKFGMRLIVSVPQWKICKVAFSQKCHHTDDSSAKIPLRIVPIGRNFLDSRCPIDSCVGCGQLATEVETLRHGVIIYDNDRTTQSFREDFHSIEDQERILSACFVTDSSAIHEWGFWVVVRKGRCWHMTVRVCVGVCERWLFLDNRVSKLCICSTSIQWSALQWKLTSAYEDETDCFDRVGDRRPFTIWQFQVNECCCFGDVLDELRCYVGRE